MKENYDSNDFEVKKQPEGWVYTIFSEWHKEYYGDYIDAAEWFETEQEARYAAITHIQQLMNGPDDLEFIDCR